MPFFYNLTHSIMYKSPKATVGAIVYHPEFGKNKILLTKRNIEPFKNYWCFPGGHVDEYEALLDAVKREVREETGLAIAPEYLGNFEEIFPQKEIHNIAIFYFGEGIGFIKADEIEVNEIEWFDINEALKLDLAFEHNRVLKNYLKVINS